MKKRRFFDFMNGFKEKRRSRASNLKTSQYMKKSCELEARLSTFPINIVIHQSNSANIEKSSQ